MAVPLVVARDQSWRVSLPVISLGAGGGPGIRARHGSFLSGICEDRGMEPGGPARLAAAGVTAREAEVLAVIGERLANREIAERLCISVRTVESHISALLRKLGLAGRPALVQLARQLAGQPALPVAATSFVGREDELAQMGGLRAAAAAGERDQAYARWAAGWVHAYRRQEQEALGCLGQVIAYAAVAGDPWLEASAWQARGLARERSTEAFDDWQRAAVGFTVAGDLMHASNVRYMMAHRAVEAGERLEDVPVWLDECESFAAGHGYPHELAHIHLVRAVYARQQGRADAARELLDGALTVFRQDGDFRCVTRTLLELAGHHRPGQPEAAADLLLQGLGMAMLAGSGALCRHVLAGLDTAAAEAGNLPLAARALGALDALGQPQAQAGTGDDSPSVPAGLASALQDAACAVYVQEGRAGGISLIISLYSR